METINIISLIEPNMTTHKKLLLLNIYITAELYMLTDKSIGYESTKRFIDNAFSINFLVFDNIRYVNGLLIISGNKYT